MLIFPGWSCTTPWSRDIWRFSALPRVSKMPFWQFSYHSGFIVRVCRIEWLCCSDWWPEDNQPTPSPPNTSANLLRRLARSSFLLRSSTPSEKTVSLWSTKPPKTTDIASNSYPSFKETYSWLLTYWSLWQLKAAHLGGYDTPDPPVPISKWHPATDWRANKPLHSDKGLRCILDGSLGIAQTRRWLLESYFCGSRPILLAGGSRGCWARSAEVGYVWVTKMDGWRPRGLGICSCGGIWISLAICVIKCYSKL